MNATPRSDHLVGRVLGLLADNDRLYGLMIGHLDRETTALKTHDLAALEQAISGKTATASQLKSLESERLSLIRKLAAETGAAEGEVTLKTLAAAHPTRSAELTAARQALADRVSAVAEKNAFNRGLIEKLMVLNYDTAASLAHLTQPEGGYGKTAKADTAAPFKAGRVVSRKL
jgi:hypothetical protein